MDRTPLCKIAQETGEVPLSCLFNCPRGCHAEVEHHAASTDTKCNRCGSTDVRWRQQGGKWVMFSLQPGVLHQCPGRAASADEFEAV